MGGASARVGVGGWVGIRAHMVVSRATRELEALPRLWAGFFLVWRAR